MKPIPCYQNLLFAAARETMSLSLCGAMSPRRRHETHVVLKACAHAGNRNRRLGEKGGAVPGCGVYSDTVWSVIRTVSFVALYCFELVSNTSKDASILHAMVRLGSFVGDAVGERLGLRGGAAHASYEGQRPSRRLKQCRRVRHGLPAHTHSPPPPPPLPCTALPPRVPAGLVVPPKSYYSDH